MAELNTLLADAYDREAFERVYSRHQGLQNLNERMARILPHPEALLFDLFSLLFKLNTVLRPAQRAVTRSTTQSTGNRGRAQRRGTGETSPAYRARGNQRRGRYPIARGTYPRSIEARVP